MDTHLTQNLPVSLRLENLARSMMIADLMNGVVLLPGGGWADPFDDETYVDTGLISTSGKTKIGDLTANGGLAAAFDGTVNANAAAARKNTSSAGYTNSVGVDWGVGVTKTVVRYKVFAATDVGLRGAEGGSFRLEGSNDNSAWDVLHTQAGGNLATGGSSLEITSGITLAAYRYHRLTVSGDGSVPVIIGELQLFEAASSNQSYNATTDLYSPTVNGGTVTISPVSGTTNMGQTYVDRTTAVDNGRTVTKIGVSLASAATVTVKIVKMNSTTSFDVVYSESFSHPGGGFADKTLATPYVIPGSGTYYIAVYGLLSGVSVTGAVARSYIGGDVGVSAGQAATADTGPCFATRYVYTAGVNNMTVVSKAFTATSQKDQALVVVQAKPNEAITPNTDLMAYLARDIGADYAQVTLSDLGITAPDGSKFYGGQVDLRSKPSGTTMRVKANTANGKNVDVSGWGVDLAA